MDGKQVWSEETYTLRNVVYDIGLPTVVKVSEGIYSDNEVETFSCGDLIKLDFQKSINKVSAQFLDEHTMSESTIDEFGYHVMKEEILIPLDYRGQVKVIQPKGRKSYFFSVKELADAFPKHVYVEKPIKVYVDKRNVRLRTGTVLELDRVIPGVGLICHLDEKDIMLNLEQKGKFRLKSDERIYSLKEIVDNFLLPQYVKVLDKEFQKMATEDLDDVLGNFKKFCGFMKIQNVVKQRVVIGHHKSLNNSRKIHCERSIALFPLDNLSVTGILVHVPLYTEPDDYQLILARNFSNDLQDKNTVDGVIYLEFAKNTRARIINTRRLSRKTNTPPIPILPPPRKDGGTMNYSSEEDIYEDAITPPLPKLFQRVKTVLMREKPRKCSHKSLSVHSTESADDTYLEPQCTNRKSRHSYITPLRWNTSRYENVFEPLASVFSSSIKTSNADFKQFLPSPIFMRNASPPITQNDLPFRPRPKMPLPSSSEEENSNNTDVMSPKLPTKRKVKSGRETNCIKNRTVSDTYDPRRENQRQISFSSRNDNIPLATVRPQVQPSVPAEPSCLTSLSVEELSASLRECGMSKLAKTCERELLDGAFINGLTTRELKISPFFLSSVELKKIQMMKEGWRPNRKLCALF